MMKEVKVQKQFKRQYTHYSVSLKMMTNGSLLIEVEDQISLGRWWRLIDEPLIKEQEDPFYQFIFTDPEFIFAQISHSRSQISFKPDVLNFIFQYGRSVKRTKIMTIPLAKEERDLDLAHMRIDKIQQKNAQRDTKIKLLEQKSAKMEDLMLKLIDKMAQLERRQDVNTRQMQVCINKEEEKSKKIQEICKQVQLLLQKEEKTNNVLQERLKKEQERILILEDKHKDVETFVTKQIQSLRERQKYCEKFINFPQISHHMGNNHSQYYALTKTSQGSNKLQKTGGENRWYNFVNKTQQISKHQNKYIVKIAKVTNKYLQIGFCTEKGLGNINNCNHAESVYYSCFGEGQLWERGTKKMLSACGSVDGDVVECEADLVEGKISWSKGGKIVTECSLPATMKGRPVYFSILIAFNGDFVEVATV